LFIFAGPNGSGKTTAYSETDIQSAGQSVWIINPDKLAARIATIEHLTLQDANLQAVRRIEDWLEASIEAHQSVGVETVLSTDKYRRLVTKAKKLKFNIKLCYVVLDSPDRNVERVRQRVAKGGHDVPEQKIRERYFRSLEQLPWFAGQADELWIYDNSGAKLKLIADKDRNRIRLFPDASGVPALVDTLRKAAKR